MSTVYPPHTGEKKLNETCWGFVNHWLLVQ